MFDYSMHQRWMRGLLIAVLLLTVLTGCSGSDDTSQQTTEDTQAANIEGTHLSADNIQKANDLIA